jgi:hypothetical protein
MKKQSCKKKKKKTIFFLSVWVLPSICSGRETETKRSFRMCVCVYVNKYTTPVTLLEEDVKRKKRKKKTEFGMEGNYQMGRGEWQNGSLASHARRRQRR